MLERTVNEFESSAHFNPAIASRHSFHRLSLRRRVKLHTGQSRQPQSMQLVLFLVDVVIGWRHVVGRWRGGLLRHVDVVWVRRAVVGAGGSFGGLGSYKTQ